jgi:hypothetical protein
MKPPLWVAEAGIWKDSSPLVFVVVVIALDTLGSLSSNLVGALLFLLERRNMPEKINSNTISNWFRTTQELEYLFILSRKARNFFPEHHIRLYDKTSESDYFFFPPPKSEYFFQQHLGIRIFFLEYNQVKWSFP